MKSQLLPNSFTDKIADPRERKRIVGSPLTSPQRQAVADMKLERELHKLICNELLRRDIVFIHSRTDKKASIAAGLPDFCFVIKGMPVAIECKSGSGKVTDEQLKTLARMMENGWFCFVVYSFQEFLDCIKTY